MRPPSSGVNAACARFIATELEEDLMMERITHERAPAAYAQRAQHRDKRETKKKVRWGEQASSHDIDEGRYEPVRVELEKAFVDWLDSEGVVDGNSLWSPALVTEEDLERFHDDLLECIPDDDSVCVIREGDSDKPKIAANGDAALDNFDQETRRRRSSLEFHTWLASITDLRSESDSTAPLM